MKMNFYFIWSCFNLLCIAMLMVSCSKEIETTDVLTPNVTLESSERSCISSCTQCALNFCCCRIEVLDPINTDIDVQICGELPECTSIDTCSISAVGNCPEIRGILLEDVPLSSTVSFFYCHEKDGAIRLRNLESFDITIRVTCMVDDVTSMFTDVLIAGFGAATVYMDSDCEPDECN